MIATLEVPELNAQLAGAQAEVRHSQSEITRAAERGRERRVRLRGAARGVHTAAEASKERPGLIAEQELDDARAKDQSAAAQIDVAKAALEASSQQLGVSQADSQRVQDTLRLLGGRQRLSTEWLRCAMRILDR